MFCFYIHSFTQASCCAYVARKPPRPSQVKLQDRGSVTCLLVRAEGCCWPPWITCNGRVRIPEWRAASLRQSCTRPNLPLYCCAIN
jgi:hypothetical protein